MAAAIASWFIVSELTLLRRECVAAGVVVKLLFWAVASAGRNMLAAELVICRSIKLSKDASKISSTCSRMPVDGLKATGAAAAEIFASWLGSKGPVCAEGESAAEVNVSSLSVGPSAAKQRASLKLALLGRVLCAACQEK